MLAFFLQARGLAQADSSAAPGLEELKDRVEGMNESLSEIRDVVDVLRKIKVTGYLLAQYRYTEIINQRFLIGTL